jgi:uncharacterized protein YjiS (DUF1127 family)
MSIFAKFHAYRTQQKAIRQLSAFDDRTLRDMGLDRSGIRDVILNGR